MQHSGNTKYPVQRKELKFLVNPKEPEIQTPVQPLFEEHISTGLRRRSGQCPKGFAGHGYITKSWRKRVELEQMRRWTHIYPLVVLFVSQNPMSRDILSSLFEEYPKPKGQP